MAKTEAANAMVAEVETETCDFVPDCACQTEGCNLERFDTRDMNKLKIIENLTKRFRLTDGSFLVTSRNKSNYGLLGGNKMVRGVLQGITPIDNHLTEVERGMLEAFELTENMKATEEISIDITKEDLQIY